MDDNLFAARTVSKAEARKRAARDLLAYIDATVIMSEQRVRDMKERRLKNNITLAQAELDLTKKIQALLVREMNAAHREMTEGTGGNDGQ